MENLAEPSRFDGNEEQTAFPETSFTYPPKFQKPEEQPGNIWLRSIASLALYLILGYYIFHSFEMLLLITAIVVFHELGHFFAMKFYRYKDLGIFFIPLLGAYVSGSKREVSQKESAVILLAGPLPGIIAGIIMYFLYKYNPSLYIGSLSFYTVSLLTIFLNLINLFPVYPLDGGQLLNRVFLDEESWLSKVFVFLSIGVLTWFALYGMSRPFYPLLIFPAMMLFRMIGDNKLTAVEKKIETEGFDLDLNYDELPDEDYWKIRNILIQEHSAFKDIAPAPPFEYSAKEEKIMSTIQSLLHRHLIQDVSIVGKIFILLIWLAAIASPWLIDMDLSFFRRFGF
ncbi:site-2 protease family protein [Terrimonas alba]|uniref:site-2 protease family protein n=1 Tax=Terrimonas alba TaxID=3349636 RepID=UPI0035F28F59